MLRRFQADKDVHYAGVSFVVEDTSLLGTWTLRRSSAGCYVTSS
jgi:hypothetical protein